MGRVVVCDSPEAFASHLNQKGSFGQSKGVVVDFTASWCGPCKMFAPLFEAASDQYPNITFLKVDVDDLQEVAQQCQIRSMPTCQAYVNAAKVDEFIGADKAKLAAMLQKIEAQVGQSSAGSGRKLGGDDAPAAAPVAPAAGAAVDEAAARRARMAAAAEARMKSAAS